jgi:hypothetical protein
MRQAFLIMPFRANLEWLRQEIVIAGVDAGFTVIRGDDIFTPGVILEQIESSIMDSEAIIAVCTGKSANVFYELGIARMFHDPILVAETEVDLPFDVSHFRSHLYGNNRIGVRDAVSAALTSLPRKPIKPLLRHLTVEVVTEQVVTDDRQDLYWIDRDQVIRRLPNSETSSLFSAMRPTVHLPSVKMDRLIRGRPIRPLAKQDFRRINHDVFALLEGYWFYIRTLAPVYQHGWASVDDLPEMTDAERRNFQPFL